MGRRKAEYSDNFREVARELGRAGIAIQEAAAEAINIGAAFIEHRYKTRLRRLFTLRNNYTTGAIGRYKANARRSNGRDLRKLHDINAVIGVRKLKGGGDHYLLAQEFGGVKRGTRRTAGKVPVPLQSSRTSRSNRKPVAPRYRLIKKTPTQRTDLRGLNPRQQYGALRDRARRGQINRTDLIQTENGIFQVEKNKITLLRSTKKSRVHIRAWHPFQDSIDDLNERVVVRAFRIAARRLLRSAGFYR